MNELQIFNNEEFGSVRSLVIDGEPYFIGKDVAEILGYGNTRDALAAHVDEEDKVVIQKSEIATLEIPNRGLTVINESGLYSLILSSKLPSAKRFKRWVTSEVLPAIRKTGGYHIPQTYAEALRELAVKAEEMEKLALENKTMQPKALFADAVTASDSSILVRDLAKILRQNGCDMGEKRLYKWLRENSFIIKGSTQPTQKAMEMGLFEIIERTVQRADMPPMVKSTTKVTGKGQQYFISKFLNS